MNKAEKLAILKSNLQLLTNVQDEFLKFLLDAAAAAMAREGIAAEDTADYYACQIDYAAYLFRKRSGNTSSATMSSGFAPSGGDTAMPRFLRRMMNNILMAQKAVEVGDDV